MKIHLTRMSLMETKCQCELEQKEVNGKSLENGDVGWILSFKENE